MDAARYNDPACVSTAVLRWWNQWWDDVTVEPCRFHAVSMESMTASIELDLR